MWLQFQHQISFNPLTFKPEFTIVIFIHYKSRIAFAIVVNEDDLKWVTNDKKRLLLLKQLSKRKSF